MRITVDNYEAFLLDAMEGNLNPVDEAALDLFFQAHPELDERAELDAFPKLELANDAHPDKTKLYKGLTPVGFITADNYEDAFIAEVEKLLSEQERQNVNDFVSANTHLEQDYKLFHKTRVEAPAVHFPNKTKLLKSTPVVQLFASSIARIAVAASVAVLLGVAVWLGTSSEINAQQYASRLSLPEVVKENSDKEVFEVPYFQNAKQNGQSTTGVSAENSNLAGIDSAERAVESVGEMPLYLAEQVVFDRNEPKLRNANRMPIPQKPSYGVGEVFLAGIIEKVKERLPESDELQLDEPLYAQVTEPVKEAVNNTIRYENLSSDSLNRKGWLLALGPVTLSRVRYE